jgi:imidazolonepropionase-like amidohydrolase
MKAVKCGKVIDGQGGTPFVDGIILVDGEKIVAVGPANTVSVPEDAEIIDLSDKTVMPGMIDCHVHTNSNGEPATELKNMKELLPFKALKALSNAQKDLYAGFTSIRDCGASGFVDLSVKQAINQGLYVGPRMQVSGPIISMTGGHGDTHLAPEVIVDPSMRAVVDSPDEARKAARVHLKYHVDLIKLAATGGVLSDGTEPGSQQLSYEEMKAAIDEGKKLGKPSAAHAQGTKGIKDAIRAGITSIEHGCFLDAEAIQMMLDHGTYLVPTLCAPYHIAEHGIEGGIPEYGVRKTKMVIASHVQSFKDAYKAGVKIAMGTDAATPFNYHGKNAFELQLMVEAGMTPMDAILSTTRSASELMGWQDQVGTLQSGKFADIIAIDGDPLVDIKVLQDVKFVMKGGAIIKS